MATPCAFYMEGKELRVVVHGDDFTILGHESDLKWFRDKIRKRFEVKIRGRIGPDNGDEKSTRILNRIVEWTEEGINYEADQRHGEFGCSATMRGLNRLFHLELKIATRLLRKNC